MLARLLPDAGILPSVEKQDAMLYNVEIRREDADLAKAMSAIREWLDGQRFEPDAFRYTSGDAGVIFRLEFKRELEARACADAFGGETSRKA
jgi:hypothetical protein